jgi:hypothetical protein
VQVVSPDDGVVVAVGVGIYTPTRDDLDAFAYYNGGWAFDLNGDDQIVLASEY